MPINPIALALVSGATYRWVDAGIHLMIVSNIEPWS